MACISREHNISVLGETVYRIIPQIKQIVDRELMIMRWTKGVPTTELFRKYVLQRRQSPLLEWDTEKKKYDLRICITVFADHFRCTIKKDVVPNLILNNHGEWEYCPLCRTCLLLFI